MASINNTSMYWPRVKPGALVVFGRGSGLAGRGSCETREEFIKILWAISQKIGEFPKSPVFDEA